MLNNSLILIISFIALFCALFARISLYKTLSAPLFVISYLCVVFSVTYAFLLGIDVEKVLTYILAYLVLFATVFWNKSDESGSLPVKPGAEK